MTDSQMERLFVNLALNLLNPLKLFFDKSPRNDVTENSKCTVIDCSVKISIPTRETSRDEVFGDRSKVGI